MYLPAHNCGAKCLGVVYFSGNYKSKVQWSGFVKVSAWGSGEKREGYGE